MRSPFGVRRESSVTIRIDNFAKPFNVIDLPRNEYFEVVRQGDQTSIEHPMHRARERNTVGDDVRTVCLDCSDMSGFCFGAPAAIDELETG